MSRRCVHNPALLIQPSAATILKTNPLLTTTFNNEFADALIHYIWSQLSSQFQNFNEIQEKLKFTPRLFNPNIKLTDILKHITWILNININVIGFKRSRNYNLHCENNSICYFPYYIFQNTLVKLIGIPHITNSINIISYKKKFYISNNFDLCDPFLLSVSNKNINLNNSCNVLMQDVIKIIKNENIELPFNINIFTSYYFIHHERSIQKNLIGSYKKDSNLPLHQLFIVPNLTGSNINIYVIDNLPKNKVENISNALHSQIKETNYLYKNSSIQETLLNQEFCVCENEETKRIFSPNHSSFKNIGKTKYSVITYLFFYLSYYLASFSLQKYFLYENLGALGLLDEQLKRKLRICSEISLLSYDTEALNKSLFNDILLDEDTLINQFQDFNRKKISYGVQQLYIIGLCDPLPIEESLQILQKYLPYSIYNKLHKFSTKKFSTLRSYINFSTIKSKISRINFVSCSNDLLNLLDNNDITQRHIKTFHINRNNTNTITEPTMENTLTMIYKFISYIYQRNILATLIKYIILNDILSTFEKTLLVKNNKGIFSLIKLRLNEILFETILIAFNGSNYDNYLLINYLIIIQSFLKQKIKIFKKGASISTIYLKISNMTSFENFSSLKRPKKKKVKNFWPLNLYIKDVRNLVAPNMSLDKIGKLFNLPVSKLCFPYNQAISIKKLKSINSLNPNNHDFWKDNFSNKKVSIEIRQHAQQLYEQHRFNNLYEFGTFYLIQDCILLHLIVNTLFKTYLQDNINIYTRRNFSQSSLAYQQFFIIEPSQQIEQNLAPKKINNTFCNYFIKTAITGGLCTSFVHGIINKETIINEHFNYLDNPNLNKHSWPNFNNILNWKEKPFKETPCGISTIDICSLYPSAAIKELPINSPLIYSRFTFEDFIQIKDKKLLTFDIHEFCKKSQQHNNQQTDYFKLLNNSPRFFQEFYAIQNYLKKLPTNISIIRFQTNFTALGQLYFNIYPIDAYLCYKDNNNKIYIKLIQYHSTFYHGHKPDCELYNEKQAKTVKTTEIKENILQLIQVLQQDFKETQKCLIEYIEIFDCDFHFHNIPKDSNYNFYYKKNYKYLGLLNDIYNNKLKGFILVKNLEIAKTNQNPLFGFIIQKLEYELKNLSPYTQDLLQNFQKSKRVVSLNKSKSFMIISTEYFNWLAKTFGFQNTPDIYHAIFFQTAHYLKNSIEKKLILRKQLKDLIKNENNLEKKYQYEIKAELLKLMLNSCYGFTLCNLTSSKFKIYENRTSLPKMISRRNKINSCIKILENVYLVELKKNREIISSPFLTMLGHIGCSILFHSKIILLKRLYFLLKYLNPTKAQLLYMDTDSAHILLKYKKFSDNVDSNLQYEFLSLFDKHFETGPKISGIWVEENFFEMGEYIGEKSYKLSNETNSLYLTHMKGLSSAFQHELVTKNINITKNPYIAYNIFHKSPDFMLYKTYMCKNLFSNYIPVKRYFISSTGSLPLKL